MTYAESIDFLYGLRLSGIKLGLDNTRQLAAWAGNPQDRLKFIHIAGTNGKGSVAAMLESVYRAAGLKVGLFTSPHLVSFRERIQVDRRLISQADVVRGITHLQQLTQRGAAPPTCPPTDTRDVRFTFFEFTTLLALRYFEEQQCDLVIWETGLGGRLDSTNIVTPLASVITNIQADHQHWLGQNLRDIAAEKAGIIKPHQPVITAVRDPDALAVIQTIAARQQSPLTLVAPADANRPPLDRLHLPLPGPHQRLNAATALATIDCLQPLLPVSPEAIRAGLETVHWPGRMQWVPWHDGQPLLVDGAHNVSAAHSLRSALQALKPERPVTLIVGILKDKDWEGIGAAMAPIASTIVCVRIATERSLDPETLAASCRRVNPSATVTVAPTVQQALLQAPPDSLRVVAGSLYLAGEVLRLLESAQSANRDESALNDWTGFPPNPTPPRP